MAKKFNETQVGKWLSVNAPKVIETVGTFYPPAQLLSRLIGNEPDLTPEQKTEFEQLLQTTYFKEMDYALANTSSARDIYRESRVMTDKLATRVMTWNLPGIFLMVLINIGCVKFLDSALLAIVSNVIGMVINQLNGERNNIINFFFGSSLGSKEKDKQPNGGQYGGA